jgi:hypothetical protein
MLLTMAMSTPPNYYSSMEPTLTIGTTMVPHPSTERLIGAAAR